MRTRNALTRLAAVAPHAEPVLDAGDEDRILARILASPRRTRSHRPLMLVLAGAVVVCAAALASALALGGSHRSATQGQQHAALTGAGIEMAGYHFRTPAGFRQSTGSCWTTPVPGEPRPTIDGFAAAASAEGGCVEVTFIPEPGPIHSSTVVVTPTAGEPVEVGSHQGYFQTNVASGDALYVKLREDENGVPVYLVLFSQGLTKDQLIAVAESGIATLPPAGPTETTGTETTG